MTHSHRELGSDGVGPLWEKPQHPGKATHFFYRVEWRGRVIAYRKTRRQGLWYTAGSSRQVYLILVGMVFIGEQSSDYKYPGRESYSGHFLCTLSISTFGPEEGFAIFL